MSSRYNGPGANLRGGQARVPRPTRSRTDSRTADSPSLYPTERQRMDKYDPTSPSSAGPPKDLSMSNSPHQYGATTHNRQWSDTSSLQGGTLPSPHHHQPYHGSQNYPYSNNNHSPYMGPSSNSPASPPPLSSSPSSSSSYQYAADQRSPHGQGYSGQQSSNRQHQQHPQQYSSRAYQQEGQMGGGGSRAGTNGYGQYDESPMLSPTTPDSWRSPPGPRGHPHYRQPTHQKPYSTTSSVSNDDHRGGQRQHSNYTQEYDSDDYYRQSGRSTPYGHGQGRYANDRDGRSLGYSTSVASNTSSVLAARRERNERNQRQKQPPTDEWLTSPATEHETEILPWSDDEAIVSKAIRSPPLGYTKGEKTLPPIPPSQGAGPTPPPRRKMDSDMIKVEVGEATSYIPTTDESSGINFIKSIPSTSSSPPPPPLSSRYNNSSHLAQSMTGAATSLRAAAALDQKSKAIGEAGQGTLQARSNDASDGRPPSDWSGQRISLEDMTSSPSVVSQDARQQAIDSWRTSPPLRAQESRSSFTELKNKRRSSLPDKFVPDWNSNAGQRRTSWGATGKGVQDDIDNFRDKDGFLVHLQHGNKSAQHSADLSSSIAGADTSKAKDSTEGTSKRRSSSWSSRRSRSRSSSLSSATNDYRDNKTTGRGRAPSIERRRISVTSSLSRSRSRSHSRSRSRSSSRHSRSGRKPSRRSLYSGRSHTVSLSRSRSISRSRSRSQSRSRSRSRSPYNRDMDGGDTAGTDRPNGKGNTRESDRYSWRSTEDATSRRQSWGSIDSKKAGDTPRAPRPQDRGRHMDSDDSMDSPPLTVQYGRRAPSEPTDDDQTISSKYPVSIISTLSLPPAASPVSPYLPPPPVPTTPTAADGTMHRVDDLFAIPIPPIPASPPQAAKQPPSIMTAVTTVSIEAETFTLLSSRTSVDRFHNFPDQAADSTRRKGLADTDTDTDFDSEAEASHSTREMPAIQPSYVSMTTNINHSQSKSGLSSDPSSSSGSTALTSAPLSIITDHLSRNTSSTSTSSILSARSVRSFKSPSSAQSSSSILAGSPPPQRALPTVPTLDSGGNSLTTGPGSFTGAKRSVSGGSARGARSGLSKQILPPSIPLPPGPPPIPSSEVSGSKPSYGILPPPIPSSFNLPSGHSESSEVSGNKPSYGILPPPIPSSFNLPSDHPGATGAGAPAGSAAIQIQVLEDESQSKSQIGAISMESEERLLTRLNNRIAQLEKELEFAQQDLETSQDDVLELQNKVRDLEGGLGGSVPHFSAKAVEGKHEDAVAKDAWEKERSQFLKDMERIQEEHQETLQSSLQKEQQRHAEEMDRLVSDHDAALQDQQAKASLEVSLLRDELTTEYQIATDDLQTQFDDLQKQLETLGMEHAKELEAKALEHQQEYELRLESIREENDKALEALKGTHLLEIQGVHQRTDELQKTLTETVAERDQAVGNLTRHRKETEQALDQLEVILTENKRAHAELIQELEVKSKRLEEQVARFELERQELLQDNVQIVEEMQRREDLWAQERILLRAGQEDEGTQQVRLQEMHEQLVAAVEAKQQADSQFQGIVKGLLREAASSKKELADRKNLIEQGQQEKEQLLEQIDVLQKEKQTLEDQKEALVLEKELAEERWGQVDKSQQDSAAQLEAQQRSNNDALVAMQTNLEARLKQQEQITEDERAKARYLERSLEQALEAQRAKVAELENALEQSLGDERAKARDLESNLEQTLEVERTKARDAASHLEKALQVEQAKVRNLEKSLEQALGAERAKARDFESNLEQVLEAERTKVRDLENTLEQTIDSERAKTREAERALEAERAKTQDLEDSLEQTLSRNRGEIEQEQFTWKTRLDQVETTLKAREDQVRKLEQEADATVKLQKDLIQSMERDASNTNKNLEASLQAKLRGMEQAFEKEKSQLQQQIEQDFKQRYERESADKELDVQQQLESMHQQELTMAKQDLAAKHEQQIRALKQQHETALGQSSKASEEVTRSMKEQLDNLQQQVQQEKFEKEAAIQDRAFLEKRMAGHERRQKELEDNLEAVKKQLEQTQAKFGQDLHELERAKASLERKYGRAKDDVMELSKLKDDLENDSNELRKELHHLKKAGSSKSSGPSAADTAAWEAERAGLLEQVNKLEVEQKRLMEETQIMLEKNMNLTIELSMRG